MRPRPLERGGRLADHDQDDLKGLGDLARPVGSPGFRAGHRSPAGQRISAANSHGGAGHESAASRGSPPVPAVTHPGVVADCTSAPPHRLSIRSATIVLACADDGLGVQKLAWTTWGASTVTGHGTFWEHVCVPYCAASNTYACYPVTLTLSQVKTSVLGQWFSRLTLTWPGKRPSVMPDAFPLDAPDS